MSYNPNIHHRRSIRLKGYDYSQAGWYYITICCAEKLHRFGKIENSEMILNDFGQIAQKEWKKLPERYPNVVLDVFQIMPNHIHFVLVINNNNDTDDDDALVGATLAVALDDDSENDKTTENGIITNRAIADNRATANNKGATARVAPTTGNANANSIKHITVGNIIGAYKSLVMNRCLELCKQQNDSLGKFWQRNYYETIIRNQKSYQNIYKYIATNPMNWETDELF